MTNEMLCKRAASAKAQAAELYRQSDFLKHTNPVPSCELEREASALIREGNRLFLETKK